MFNKVALLAFVAPLVAGLTLQIPENPTSGGSVTIKWTSASGDPATFTLELTNESFHNSFAIANNVQPESGQITLNLPVVPVGDGYTLEAVDIGNISNVYSTTGSFSVGANAASSSSTSSGTSTTSTGTSASTLTSPLSSVTPTSATVTGTHTTGTASITGTSTGTASSTSAATTSNAAMAPLKINSNIGAVGAALFSVIAGAAIVAL